MRIATYNVEWFSELFDQEGALRDDEGWSSRYKTTRRQQLAAVGRVFQEIDADAVMIVEAPDGNGKLSTVTALENFARHFGLRARKALVGFVNDTQQEIALLYDPDKLSARHDPKGAETSKKGASGAPRFDGGFRWDLDIDAASEVIHFSKPPLEAEIVTSAGNVLRLIGVHIKSKAPHGAKNHQDMLRISIQNRRKQLAQCIWLRNRVVDHLAAGDNLIVLGDFNDGPGLDEFEELFGRSGVEVVLGESGTNCLFDPHAQMALTRRGAAVPTSARFYISHKKRYLQTLLDYIMVSAAIKAKSPDWRIWHPFEDPTCYNDVDLREALLAASDHFPVTMDLDI